MDFYRLDLFNPSRRGICVSEIGIDAMMDVSHLFSILFAAMLNDLCAFFFTFYNLFQTNDAKKWDDFQA